MNFWVQLQRKVSETDRQTAPHLGEWHHWGIRFPKCVHGAQNGKVAVWLYDLSFLFPPLALLLQPPEYPSKPAFSHRESLSYILDTSLIHVPLTQFLSLGIGRKFTVIYPSFSKHEYLIACWVVILSVFKHLQTKRNLFPPLLGINDLEISPLYWLKQYLSVSSIHWFWTTYKEETEKTQIF